MHIQEFTELVSNIYVVFFSNGKEDQTRFRTVFTQLRLLD